MKVPVLKRNKRKAHRIEAPIITEDEPVPVVRPYPIDFIRRRTRARVKRERIVIDWYVECQKKAGVDMGWLGEQKAVNWEYAAKKLLEKYSMDELLSCITWMSSPNCKYYQYPFGLRHVRKMIEEFLDLKERGLLELRHYQGLLGELVNVKELEPPVPDG